MINVVDDELLFNPKIRTKGEIIKYKDINRNAVNRFSVVVFFYTADVNSVLYETDKINMLFAIFSPLLVILMDERKQHAIGYAGLIVLNFRKKYQEGSINKLINYVTQDIDRLFLQKRKRIKSGAKRPIYIKTTMFFGIQSGGAVAHSVGVLTSLRNRYDVVPVYTTDYLPEDVIDINVNKISLEGYWDFYDEAKLYLNTTGYKKIINREKTVPLFIYQRCSLYDYLGVKVSIKYRTPLVLEWNGSDIWVSKNWDGRTFKYRRLAEKIERLNLEKADLITCVSEELKNGLIEYGIPEEKILVNFNGVDTDKFNPRIDGREIRRRLGVEEAVVIGFCGSFARFHGAEILAEAFGELINENKDYLTPVYLLMIGEGNTLSDVKKILKRKNVFDRARCVGSVSFDDVPYYLAACDIVVSPHIRNDDGSEFFGSPTKLFEYMAMGKAIIASDLNQIGTILSDGYSALLTEPGNVRALKERIKRLSTDKDLMNRLGANARKEAVKNHSWDKHVDNIIHKLEEMSLV